MKTNKKAVDYRVDTTTRLAGGQGAYAAKQDAEALLRRSVLACLLWEDNAYEDGTSIKENICRLIPQVEPQKVFDIAVEARFNQKLRHVPLLIAREMARLDTHKHLVSKLLPMIVRRADELTEFMALYWADGKQPISKQVKLGLAKAFDNFDAYQFAKYDRDEAIKLRDVMFMVHPNPKGKDELFTKLVDRTLEAPDTWEVALSAGADKNQTWTRLISQKRIGALAFMRNLRNMEQVGVSKGTIREGFGNINPIWLLPLNYLAAAQASPTWKPEIEKLMLRSFEQAPKLPGHTILIVDVSGSMGSSISAKSAFSRTAAASAMAVMAAEMCESVSIYATSGNDGTRVHKTAKIDPTVRGFKLIDEITKSQAKLGYGGIFTRQCLEYIKKTEPTADRIIVFSDSQDCDHPNKRVPAPFGERNYIVDVSSHSRGIAYKGLWTAEITGWSEHFLEYILASEGVDVGEEEA